jgi:uncharacterized protein YcaQ
MARMPTPVLTLRDARRIGLTAQGVRRRREGAVTMAAVRRTLDRIALMQIDTVNVLARAHLMPLFTRLGPYDPAVLERISATPPRRVFEYWGHEAALIDMALYPAWRWKMVAAEQHAWHRMIVVRRDQPGLVDAVLAAVTERGPLTARELDVGRPKVGGGGWWNWSDAKTALEWLFYAGKVTCAGRNSQFERRYDLPERVIPPDVWALPALDRAEAHRVLVARAARALGVATDRHLADYFRLTLADTREAVEALAADGRLAPVEVAGWRERAWLAPDAPHPAPVHASCLVSPFDSVVFDRRRLLELFGIDYRIEIYTPAPRRRWGYYVYLYLRGEAIAARIDLKADRKRAVLVARASWREPTWAGTEPVEIGLADQLWRLAGWLGLSDVEVDPRGDLAGPLARAIDRG